MTVAQYKNIMTNKDFKKDVVYILGAENTKIYSNRFSKVELDETNEMLIAYCALPKSIEGNEVHYQSFVMSIDNILGVQFKNPFGNEIYQGLVGHYMTDY